MMVNNSFENWAAANGYRAENLSKDKSGEYKNHCVRDDFLIYKAAYLAGAKAMQEEAAKRCEKDLYRGEHFAEVIRAINPENLK